MTKGNFYFLTDEYCDRFKKYGVMDNKEAIGEELHGRPCFYAFPDDDDEDIFWMIPISSQVRKYEDILAEKLQRYSTYDGLEFGYVRGRRAAFLLQNICPVTKKYIREEYIDCNTSMPVCIPNDLQRAINAKARKIVRFAKKGTKISITNIMEIIKALKAE